MSARPSRVSFAEESPKIIETYSSEEYNRMPQGDEYRCDRCRYEIDGDRYHCKSCGDYDLCAPCYSLVFENAAVESSVTAMDLDGKHTCTHPQSAYAWFGLGAFD